MAYRSILRFIGVASLMFVRSLAGAQIAVKHPVGALHGFLTIRSQAGSILGYGELSEFATGDLVTSHLVYHFFDGSLDDETTTFTQGKTFQFVSDHHIQKGRFFPKPADITVEANGHVTTRSTDKDGKPTVESTQMDIPPDFANGMVGTVLQNIPADADEFKLGMIVSSGKPRAIKLDITAAGQQPFRIAGTSRKANVFRLKTEIGGVAGVIAPILGKQPHDILVSVLEGDTPVVVRILGPLGEDTAIVSIELAGATFPKDSTASHAAAK
jgi:hypothetical protein